MGSTVRHLASAFRASRVWQTGPRKSNINIDPTWSSLGLLHRPQSSSALRSASTSPTKSNPKLQTHDRGPPSDEDTQTDFRALDIYSNTSPPATTIDACLSDGFHINNGLKVTGGDGIILFGGEAFAWRPWMSGSSPTAPNIASLLSKTGAGAGALHFGSPEMFGAFSLLHPLPDLLILGTGATTRPVTRQTRDLLAGLGVKVDIMDTNNAAASFNLLCTERGLDGVAAAMLPAGWKGSSA